MTTLFDLVWRSLVELGTAKTGIATGGSTTTIIDTEGLKLIDNDYYNEGTALILRTTDDLAPLREYSAITDFANATKTLTLLTALTAAPGAGDTFGVATRRYPLNMIIQKINNALYLDGYIPGEDTSLVTVSNQNEYTMPVGVSRDLRQVSWQTNQDTDQNNWVPVVNWKVQKTATGSGDTLVLAYELPAGYKLWLRYAKQHDELVDPDDILDVDVHADRIVYAACAELLRSYRDRTRLRTLDSTIDHLDLKAQRAKDLHPLPQLPSRQSKVMRFNRTFELGSRYYSEG